MRSKKKKIKLTSIPVIHRRLFRIASQVCRENANETCEICGLVKGDVYNHKKQRVEAHHIMSRSNKDSPLKWDVRNLICLCTKCHKTGRRSAHKHGLWFAREFYKIRPEDYEWIIEHTDDEVNLRNRDYLQQVEENLKKQIKRS